MSLRQSVEDRAASGHNGGEDQGRHATDALSARGPQGEGDKRGRAQASEHSTGGPTRDAKRPAEARFAAWARADFDDIWK